LRLVGALAYSFPRFNMHALHHQFMRGASTTHAHDQHVLCALLVHQPARPQTRAARHIRTTRRRSMTRRTRTLGRIGLVYKHASPGHIKRNGRTIALPPRPSAREQPPPPLPIPAPTKIYNTRPRLQPASSQKTQVLEGGWPIKQIQLPTNRTTSICMCAPARAKHFNWQLPSTSFSMNMRHGTTTLFVFVGPTHGKAFLGLVLYLLAAIRARSPLLWATHR